MHNEEGPQNNSRIFRFSDRSDSTYNYFLQREDQGNDLDRI